jgi:predicted small secreted protein
MNRTFCFVILIVSVVLLQGCGETIRGVGSDLSRVGRGIRTIFDSNM